jgi:hypothetical protein
MAVSVPTSAEMAGQVVVTEGFNSAAVDAAVERVLADRTGTAAQRSLVFPPGEFHLTKPLITSAADNAAMIEGLSVRGQGKRSTKLFWDNVPSGDSPWDNNLITASRLLRFFSLSGFTAISSSPKNNFAYLWSTWTGGYNQGWSLRDIEFQGPWNRVIGLDGDAEANLNSEFVLDGVYTATNSRFTDAFFRAGGISGLHNQQNQFLNYWITNCCFTLTAGTVFRFDKGGSIRVARGSWSAAKSTAGPITWFSMPVRNSNNRSATQLSVRDVRFEPKAADHLVIDCRWGAGSVTFEDCSDLGSAQHSAGMEWNLHRYTGTDWWGQGSMPTVRYRSHQGVGYHSYSGPKVTRGNIAYDGCYWFRGVGGQLAAAGDVLRWDEGPPRYRFIDCDNVS